MEFIRWTAIWSLSVYLIYAALAFTIVTWGLYSEHVRTNIKIVIKGEKRPDSNKFEDLVKGRDMIFCLMAVISLFILLLYKGV